MEKSHFYWWCVKIKLQSIPFQKANSMVGFPSERLLSLTHVGLLVVKIFLLLIIRMFCIFSCRDSFKDSSKWRGLGSSSSLLMFSKEFWEENSQKNAISPEEGRWNGYGSGYIAKDKRWYGLLEQYWVLRFRARPLSHRTPHPWKQFTNISVKPRLEKKKKTRKMGTGSWHPIFQDGSQRHRGCFFLLCPTD